MQAERLHARGERSHEALRKSLAQSGLERRYPPVSVGAHYQRAPPVLSNTLNKREAIAVLQTVTQSMNLQELKRKTPAELLALAEELEIENASTLRKQDIMFSVLKQLAERDVTITGDGVLEVLSDGFGFLRSPDSNYLPGPDDIYLSPNQVRRYGLRTGDTVEGEIRAPKQGERYFALVKLSTINFEDPEIKI